MLSTHPTVVPEVQRQPMHRSVAVLVLAVAVAAGCNATSSPTPIATDGSRLFTIDEVGLGPDGYITVLNFTDVAASLDNVLLCQPPTCVDLPDVVVQPGAVARVAVGGGSGLESVVLTNADLELSPSDGEIAIYESRDFDDPSKLRAYLEWGSSPHQATATAIAAGLWQPGSYAPTAANATRLYRTDANLWVFETDEAPASAGAS